MPASGGQPRPTIRGTGALPLGEIPGSPYRDGRRGIIRKRRTQHRREPSIQRAIIAKLLPSWGEATMACPPPHVFPSSYVTCPDSPVSVSAPRASWRTWKATGCHPPIVWVMQQSPTRRVTEDGMEETLQVNAVAPYLLTRLLLPALFVIQRRNLITWRHMAYAVPELSWCRQRYIRKYAWKPRSGGSLQFRRPEFVVLVRICPRWRTRTQSRPCYGWRISSLVSCPQPSTSSCVQALSRKQPLK